MHYQGPKVELLIQYDIKLPVMKIISQQEIKALGISAKQCCDWIRESFSIKNKAQLPAKISCHPADFDFFTSMPCLLPEDNEGNRFFGIKEVHRIKGAVPSLGSDMMLYDAKNGTLLALLDTDWITTMRTGAVASVSARALRKVRKDDIYVYGFVGLGNTARATMLCILEDEPEIHFEVQLLQYKNQAELFIERFKEYSNVTFTIVDDINDMARNVDVFVSCITDAGGLLIEDESIFQPGITVIPVHMRGLQNCDTTFDRVFGDDTEHIKGFKYFSQYKDYNEIGEVLAGRDKGRKSQDQRIIDYNYGLALHDVLYASKIYLMLKDKVTTEVEVIKETNKFWL